MVFGYEFTTLNDDQKHARRHLLEYYPLVAQTSALTIFAGFQLCFALSWLANRGLGYERPRSPSFNKRLEGHRTWLLKAQQGGDQLLWWMKNDVVRGWGTRAEWIGGGVWTVWLLFLCIVQTGNDYLHLTKRFGIIGASQLPLHYLLAMRSPYSPIQFLTRLSHEQLKSSHQVLGRIVFFLFALHALFYLNFFILSGFLAKRIKDLDVIFGIISIGLFSIISTTALGPLRRWNYRVFYLTHIITANYLVVPLYFHVSHIRIYVYEIFAINCLHLILRAVHLKGCTSNVELLPGTDLVQIRISLSQLPSALHWQPGQHVYLNRLPVGTRAGALRPANPFTVASIPSKDNKVVLVARAQNGKTKELAEFARLLATEEPGEAQKVPISVEGPYGASRHLPDFSSYDKVLLVAGGIGATFVMPIYRSIMDLHDPDHAGHPQVRFIWAVQKLADIQWAYPAFDQAGDADPQSSSDEGTGVEVFVTRRSGASVRAGGDGEDIELEENDRLLSMEEEMKRPRKGMIVKYGRPKITAAVDEVLSKGSRVAVVTCGPKRLTRELRASVEQWVYQGQEVFWHEETFD